MTFEEIKEIRATVLPTGQEYFDAHSVEMVDALLEQVDAVGICELCREEAVLRASEANQKLTIALEALESLISANTQRITTARYIARTALERIKE